MASRRSAATTVASRLSSWVRPSRTPLERLLRHARAARLVDGADELHLSQIAANVIAAVRDEGSSRRATGLDLL